VGDGLQHPARVDNDERRFSARVVHETRS
jgi:hypothetical protein